MGEALRRSPARIPGLDLLRVISMVMVIVLHILGQGGILDAAEAGSPVWYAAWGLECLCYCAVDCYGLLSGYLGAGRRRSFARLGLLWLEVVLYSLLFYLFFRLRSPELVEKQHLIRALLPVLTRQYWYFTGYFGLMLLLPLLPAAAEPKDSPQATGRVLILLLFFCALPTLLNTDAFHLRGGYSTLWLLLLYLMGTALRGSRFFHRLGTLPLLLVFLLCFCLSFYTRHHPVTIPYVSTFTLLNYISPTVTVSAICLLLLFRRLRVREGPGRKLLSGLSQTSFGVYILHTNPLLWYWIFFPGCLGGWAGLSAPALAALVPLCGAGTYLLCSLPVCARLLLFRRLRLRERLEALEDRLRRRLSAEYVQD